MPGDWWPMVLGLVGLLDMDMTWICNDMDMSDINMLHEFTWYVGHCQIVGSFVGSFGCSRTIFTLPNDDVYDSPGSIMVAFDQAVVPGMVGRTVELVKPFGQWRPVVVIRLEGFLACDFDKTCVSCVTYVGMFKLWWFERSDEFGHWKQLKSDGEWHLPVSNSIKGCRMHARCYELHQLVHTWALCLVVDIFCRDLLYLVSIAQVWRELLGFGWWHLQLHQDDLWNLKGLVGRSVRHGDRRLDTHPHSWTRLKKSSEQAGARLEPGWSLCLLLRLEFWSLHLPPRIGPAVAFTMSRSSRPGHGLDAQVGTSDRDGAVCCG